MDMEARSFSQEKSQQLMRKVKEYKADLKKITEDSRQAQGAASGLIPAASCVASQEGLWTPTLHEFTLVLSHACPCKLQTYQSP